LTGSDFLINMKLLQIIIFFN